MILSARSVVALCGAGLLLSSCAPPVKPVGADEARGALMALKSNPQLAPQVQAALAEAELAVQAAEVPTRDAVAGRHAVHVAERKVEIARLDAERRVAEQTLSKLEQQRQAILQEGQTRELEIARAQAEAAAAAALAQQQAAAAAEAQAAALRDQTEALRREMTQLQAQATDRGMVMTLGDVLFATGKADLQPGAMERLEKLAAFLHRFTDRTLLIEGHTDDQGSEELNLSLSQRRAEAVKVYLIIQSIDPSRMSTVGRGKAAPVADNATAEGRLQNRRVEIVIQSPPVAP